MEDENILIFLDKMHKLLEYGHVPKAIAEIDVMVEMLQKHNQKQHQKIGELVVEHYNATPDTKATYGDLAIIALKVNELIRMRNKKVF